MKATQTNKEESERETQQGNSKQEKDSDQPRQKEELRGATSVAWTRFRYEKSDTDKKTIVCKLRCHTWSFYINYLFRKS